MSLVIRETGGSFEPVPDGTYTATCYMMCDIGTQINEQFGNLGPRVIIGWEIPSEPIVIDGEERPRIVTQEYRASLNNKATLFKVLESWRGKKFTKDELAKFDLRNIVGAPCMISVASSETSNGKIRTKVTAVMALPKGMTKPKMWNAPVVFDMDRDMAKINDLPEWIVKKIQSSPDYEAALRRQEDADLAPAAFTEVTEEDEDLPF